VRGVVIDRVVVDVRYIRVVNRGICDVHPIHIGLADRVRRDIDFARSERKPADPTSTTAHSNADPEVGPSDPSDYRRRIYRSRGAYRSGTPTPRSTYECPAPVMKWGEAPRCIIDPGPTPR